MISATFVLLIGIYVKTAHTGGESYALSFMNITSDGENTAGFTQIFVSSERDVKATLLASVQSVDEFVQVGNNFGLYYNETEDFSVHQVWISTNVTSVDKLGFMAYSGAQMSIIGVKSDRGSSDAFLSLRAVRTSKEFMIALWPNQKVYQGSILILGILNGTCVEIYKVFNGNTFVPVHFESIGEMAVLRFFQRYKIDQSGQKTADFEDLTGYYVNSSKPIRIIAGHECAKVPVTVGYCDHMAEQIPALNELGRRYVLPPIAGRRQNAGYVIRVVGAQKGYATVVNVVSHKVQILQFGEFTEVDVSNNMDSVLVTCDTNCLVMQYNKGFAAVNKDDDTPTDPFMMVTTPSDRFTNSATFATPSYCDDNLKRTNFDDYASIVTYTAYKDSLKFDGSSITSKTPGMSWKQLEEFSIVSFKISHGFHMITSTKGSFAAYVYGHSIMVSSPSGYGFAANYNVTQESVDEGWKNSESLVRSYLLNNSSPVCSDNSIMSGKIVSDSDHASFPFHLKVNLTLIELSDNCVTRLKAQLQQISENIRQKINQWICLQLNCSYLTSFAVAVDSMAFFFNKDEQGKYSSMSVEVDVIASYDTLSTDFATCRLEIKDYLSKYSNWLSINQILIGSESYGCPNNFAFRNNTLSSVELQCKYQ